MDTNHLSYMIEKSTYLVYKLMTGVGDAKSRLRECELEICNVLCFDYPDDGNEIKEKIKHRVFQQPHFSLGDKMYSSSFQNSIRAIRNETAAKIIGYLYDLHLNTCWFRDELNETRRRSNANQLHSDRFKPIHLKSS